jgi:hypothetical protein
MSYTDRALAVLFNLFRVGQADGSINEQDFLDMIGSLHFRSTPVVADNTARDSVYSTPTGDEKVINKSVGLGYEEFYDLANALWRVRNPSRTIAQLVAPLRIYGAGAASDQTVVTFTIPGNSIRPNSLLELDLLTLFVSPNHAGRKVVLTLGGQVLGQFFPSATMQSGRVKETWFVASDLQSIYLFSQSFNDVQSPTAGQGAPFSVNTHNTAIIIIDLTVNQTLAITVRAQNDDLAELTGFSLRNVVGEIPAVTKIQTTKAKACLGDSLTSGSESVAGSGFVLTTSGDTTQGAGHDNTITSPASTAGVLAGMVVTGPGIQADTTVTGLTGGIQISKALVAGGGAGSAIKIQAGPFPQQWAYNSPGRPVANLGVGGQTSAQILARMKADVVRGKLWDCVIWAGRNDILDPNAQSIITTNVAAMVANLAPSTNYVVCGITPANGETTGSGTLTKILATNAQLAATYGSRYVDLYALLAQGAGDLNPLYHGSATVGDPHLNDLGYYKVAQTVDAPFVALGV